MIDPLIPDEIPNDDDEQIAAELADDIKTRRTLGTIVVLCLTALAAGVLALLAAVALKGDPETLDAVVTALQPSTIVIASLSAIAGIASGAGSRGGKG